MEKTIGKEYGNAAQREQFLKDNCESCETKGFCRKFNKYVASVAVCNSFKRLKSNEEKEKGKRKESSVRKAVQYIYENEDDSLADAIVSQLETAWEDGYNTAKKDKL